MGYQALLFCTDEKLARVVSQLFSELEFNVSPVSDPFAAVKSLMAQHYDAVVIDCENEQSASLMIKSARNSTFNQGSLAIGLVEGQVGIAKAYRMGANLVLTKPINVEAAKGTLRVARGLLRKGTEANAGGQGTAAHTTTVAHPSSSFASAAGVASAPIAASAASATSAQGAALQSKSSEQSSAGNAPAAPYPALTRSEQAPVITPAVPTKPWTSIGSTVPVAQTPAAPAKVSFPLEPHRPAVPEQIAARIEAPKPAAAPIVSPTAKTQGAAAAPAPAKIAAPVQQPVYEEEEQTEFAEGEASSQQANFSAVTATMPGPTFSMETEHSAGSGGSQKILIGAVAVLLVIGAYFGWTKYGKSNPSPAPIAIVPQASPEAGPSPSTPAPAQASPISINHPNVASAVPGHTTSLTQPAHSPANTTTSQASVAAASAGSSEPIEIKTGPAPIQVKAGSVPRTHAQTQNQNEEASAQLPSPLDVATPSQSGLSGVLTANPEAAKPSLAKIKLSQGVSQGLLIKRVEPQYPRNALMTHTQGAVQIEATVDKEGRVVNPKVLSGPFMLAPAALEAVRQWRYKPYYLDGEPVEVQTQITINFKAH